MASTSSSMPTVGELDLEALSAYEDALDESETELKRLVEVAAERITRERPRPPAIVLPPVLRTPSSSKHKRSSSSEHSSIEKVAEGQSIRSRRTTSGRTDRPRRGGQKSSSDQSESPDDWRMINYTFQEVQSYPLLIQISQQLQMLSRELYEIESTNALQLKIIAQLLAKLIKARQRPFYTLTRVLRCLPVFFFIVFWPFVARIIYKYIARRRQGIALNILRYL
ncbi:hypothetical protein Q1695_014611 [Nippostrongylus brasiliensis]|nr:hypothetical protein Q1695_014611 [Nippostrongylus brasiliensis]